MNKVKFTILDQPWTVERVPSHDSNLYVGDNVCTGTMWAAKHALYISSELSAARAWRTLLHELCHAYVAATQAVVPESWSEEALCEFVSIYSLEIVQKAVSILKDLYGGSESE